MAISQKLMMRQGQSLVMTPQLLQAIKLLQFSSAELTAFLQEEMERNPLLESEGPSDSIEPAAAERAPEDTSQEGANERIEGDWAKEALSTDAGEYAANLGADVSNLYDSEEPSRSRTEALSPDETMGLSASSWTGALGGGGFADGETPNLEAYAATTKTLRDTLEEQLSLACEDPRQRLIGSALIDAIDENGYLRETLEAIAERLGASVEEAQAVLDVVHRFEPSGIGARDLAECLAIQLRERDRRRRDHHGRRRRKLARRAQHGGAAARSHQQFLRGARELLGERRRRQDLRLELSSERQLAREKPGAATTHDPQSRFRNRAAAGRVLRKGRRASPPAQSARRRRRDLHA